MWVWFAVGGGILLLIIAAIAIARRSSAK
jgi:hypothetical protein